MCINRPIGKHPAALLLSYTDMDKIKVPASFWALIIKDKFTHAIMGLYQFVLWISKDTHQLWEGDFKDQIWFE